VTARRWVAPSETSVAAVLSALGLTTAEGAAAVAEGRVFVGRKRATSAVEPVPARGEVILHPRPPEVALPSPFVLHDRGGILAVDKPAGIATIPDGATAHGTLLDLAARATGRSRDELHPTSRLDREVSGVVTFAVGPEARAALATARAGGAYERRYVAIACGEPPGADRWTWAIARARDPRLRRAVAEGTADAKPAATRAKVVARNGGFALLALAPETGRTHQLRVHAAAASAPLLGDRDYGGPTRLTTAGGRVSVVRRVALHCAHVAVTAGECMISVRSPVPPELVALATELGLGGAAMLEEATSCDL
jgi:23S rRNA-/tRNA-specific pseudouridylate synthase